MPRAVKDRFRRAGAGIEQSEDREFGGEAELVVVDEVADDLDAGGIDWRLDGAAEHIEMPVGDAGFEVNARFDHRLAPALAGQARFNGGQDLFIGDLEFVDVEAIEIGDIDRWQD